MKCANHPGNSAFASCNHCGKGICRDCSTEFRGESYCGECLAIKQGGQKKYERSPVLAAILSFVISGLGQFYNGQPAKGILVFLTSFLIFPWALGIIDAYKVAEKINRGEVKAEKRTGCLIAFAAAIVVFWSIIFFLVILAAIAIPKAVDMRLSANENAVEEIVKTISGAIEEYASEHEGVYPQNESDLVNADPAYLFQAYDKRFVNGYNFSVKLEAGGYTISALPEDCDVTGRKIFTMTKGGALSVNDCSAEQKGEAE